MSEKVVSEQPQEETPVVAEGESAPESKDESTEVKEETKPEKKDGFQKAIDRQTRKYYEQKARADALELQLRQANPGATAPEVNQNVSPDRTKFADDAAYNLAVIRHEANKIADAKLAQTKQADQAKIVKSKWDKDASEMRKTDADFDETIQDFFNSGFVTPAVDRAVLEADRPAAITHYLATHPEEAERIAGLSEFRTAIEIGKIEIKLTTSGSTSKKVSAAPAAIVPIAAKGGSGEIDPEKESPQEFAARRNKELSLKGKR